MEVYCDVKYTPAWGDKEGGIITEVGYDTEKKQKFVKRVPFQPVVYEGSEYSDVVDYYGNKVVKKEVKSIYDYVKNAENINGLYYAGDIKESAQYIFKNYSDIDTNVKIPYCAYDIEVLTSDIVDGEIISTGFPNQTKAERPVTCITIYKSDSDSFVTLGLLDYTGEHKKNYVKCQDEQQMLLRFFSIIRDYVIITGFNTNGFDNIYLVTRAMNIGLNVENLFSIKVNDPQKLFKTRKVKMANGQEVDQQYVDMPGNVVYDYRDLFIRYYPEKQENYSLENVSRVVLGDGKLDYIDEHKSLDHMYYNDYNMYIDYNIKDTLLIRDIDKKINFIGLSCMIAYMTKSTLHEPAHATYIWGNFVCFELLKRGIIPPRVQYRQRDSFLGGFVREPIKGKHKWVTTFDVTSLYPSLFFRGGFSELNMVSREQDRRIRQSSDMKSTDHIDKLLTESSDDIASYRGRDAISAAGFHFKRNPDDLMCRILKDTFMKKDEYARLKKNSKTQEEKDYYELMRYAIKIMINSFYGALSQQGFRFHCLESARSITETGQYLVRRVANTLNKIYGDKSIVYGDTDSIFLCLESIVKKYTLKFIEKNQKEPSTKEIVDFLNKYIDKEVQPVIDNTLRDIEKDLGFVDPGMEMGREKICLTTILKDKKKYMMAVVDNEGEYLSSPKIVIKGIDIVTTKMPKAIKKRMKDLGLILLLNDSEQEFRKCVSEFKSEWEKIEFDKRVLPKTISDMGKYKPVIHDEFNIEWVSATPQHVKAAWLYNHLCNTKKLKFQRIYDGANIRFVYLKSNNPYKTDCVAYLTGNSMPNEFCLDSFVDWNKIWEMSVTRTLDGVSAILGYKSLLSDDFVESDIW